MPDEASESHKDALTSLNAPQFDVIIFDLDGTLVDSAPELSDAVNATLAELGFEGVDPERVKTWIGHGVRELMAQALAFVPGAGACKLEAVMPVFSRHYRAHCGQNSRLYPGVMETLDALAHRGVPMALISNKESAYAKTVLRVHGLDRYLHPVVFGDSLSVRKPDPQTVQAVLQPLRLMPSRALFVGDSEIDVETARNANVPVWLVSYGYRRNTARNLDADRVIGTLKEILPAVRSRETPAQGAKTKRS